MIRATLVAFSLLSAASAPVVGQPKPFDSAFGSNNIGRLHG
jgi:hypothetical protein